MITEVDKYLILGAKQDLDAFYERAQEEGIIQFIKQGKALGAPEEIHLLLTAIKILKKSVVLEKEEVDWSTAETITFAKEVLRLKEEISTLYEEKRLTEFEIARISPFGEFSLEDLAYIDREGHRKMQFFCIKKGKAEDVLEKEGLIYINTEYELDYYIAINPVVKNYSSICPALIEMRIDRSLSLLKSHLDDVLGSIVKAERALGVFAAKRDRFQEVLLGELNAYHLASAKREIRSPLEGDFIFCVEGWVPKSKSPLFFSLLEGLSICAEQVAIEESDKVPTFMENTGVSRIGEDLVKIYDMPSIRDKDPSGWVFWFFALFFAMIVADAGYGLLYLGFAGYLKWKFKTFTGSIKRFYRLFVILSFFVVGWGVLTVSYFGIAIGQGSPLRKIAPIQWLVQAKADYHVEQKDAVYEEWQSKYPDVVSVKSGKELIEITTAKPPGKRTSPVITEFSDNILLEFSLVVGIVHISLALLRYLRRNWANVGWVVFLVGGYLFFPSLLRATSIVNFLDIVDKQTAKAFGEQLIYIGIGISLVLAVIQKGLSGIKELMNLVQVFSDVLSYVRLYALALASAIMAATFNEMGGGFGFIGGLLVILVGHITNMGLGMMSGVIHGLRLNFLEWYHFCFEGGGYSFNPLRILKLKED